jgi:DNA ligase (NAD+)
MYLIMDKNKAKKRIEKLKKEINIHRYNYHVLDKSSISDAALDALKDELFKLEQEYPALVTSDSPTQRMGGEVVDKFSKSEHFSRMLSLFDIFSEEDLFSWEDKIFRFLYGSKREKDRIPWTYYSELKLDGLALNLRYFRGEFLNGASRGDGKVGEDISSNVKTIESVPLKINTSLLSDELSTIVKNSYIEIRGEAIISKKDFLEINKKNEKEGRALLSNTRNAAAGSLRQLDSKLAAERKIQFYAYDVVFYDEKRKISVLRDRREAEKIVRDMGFKVLKENKWCENLKDVMKFYEYWDVNRGKLGFDIDGVVVKVNELDFWDKLGVVGKAPRYARAYKFPAEQGVSVIEEVVWQVGRTGILTPIALFQPVKLSGANISRATLHNMDEIERLDIRINDTVVIERSGDVIPKIVKVLKNMRSGDEHKIYPPKKCPICEGPVIKKPGEVAYRCLSSRCYAINLRQIIHFVSKKALDIENLGPKIIEQLLKEGLISDLADLYSLEKEELLALDRFAEKSADNLISSINNRREIPLTRFIYSLGIRNIGEESAEILANYISKNSKKKNIEINSFVKVIKDVSRDDLKSLDDFGPIASESFIDFFQDKHNSDILKKLSQERIILKTENRSEFDKSSPIFDKSFVLTGSLKSLTREAAKAKIKELGGKVLSSPSRKLDFLVLGDDPGSKYKEAEKLGVKIIKEKEFLKMIEK